MDTNFENPKPNYSKTILIVVWVLVGLIVAGYFGYWLGKKNCGSQKSTTTTTTLPAPSSQTGSQTGTQQLPGGQTQTTTSPTGTK